MEALSNSKCDIPNGIGTSVHVEICQNPFSTAKAVTIREHVLLFLSQNNRLDLCQTVNHFDDAFLQEHVQQLSFSDCETFPILDLSKVSLHVHVYRLHQDGPSQEELDEEDLPASNNWLLPSADFHGLWESLVFDSAIKSQLLQYVSTTLLFSDNEVDQNVISWNRVVLLHGPPGTGKTSLCKALAHKLCIQMSDRYAYGQLVEINSHSLFSKWFSESGKLVMKMFQKIQALIDDREALVCVLIDEVESLTAARKAAMGGSEPSDAIRVVNAVLTQLDQIKKNPNVIILTTSNITGAIDLAFVDRADIKQYIGPPSKEAIYQIYVSCLKELMKTGIIRPLERICPVRDLQQLALNPNNNNSVKLEQISAKSQGLSGRTLRKLPFIAHAMFVQQPTVILSKFLVALEAAVEKQFEERGNLKWE